MNLDLLAAISLVLAGIPTGLFLLNLFAYRPLPGSRRRAEAPNSDSHDEVPNAECAGISVLIPARNEEKNIGATLESVLANSGGHFEVIVLDDHSTDSTVEKVAEFVARDSRVRLDSAPPLPAGCCGKQHACYSLANLAQYPLLVFLDADVRLAPDALSRIAALMEGSDAALVSGVPRQEVVTFSERLLLPLIHFLLLGFLPMHAMRRVRWPSMSAGCGQLFVARREAYMRCGGHAMLLDSLHDGIKLPRVFRRAGLGTDLFDATDLATCRMYRTNIETWRGLGKNATEGLAAPGTIGPMTVLLFGGQVLPYALLASFPWLTPTGIVSASLAVLLSLFPRIVGIAKFRQPIVSCVLHPFGVLALLLIQWHAFIRSAAGQSAEWKGRVYGPSVQPRPEKTA